MPTVAECRRKVAYLKAGDTIEVVIDCRLHDFTKCRYKIMVRCHRPVWPAPWRRSGKGSEWFIGASKTRQAAEKRAAALLKRLQRIRDGK